MKVLLYFLVSDVLKLENEISEELLFFIGIRNLFYITLLLLGTSTNYNEAQRYLCAIHEASHTIVALLLGFDVVACNIKHKPERNGYTSFNMPSPSFYTRETYLNLIKVTYSGKIAEKVLLGTSYAVSKNDLQKATSYCKDMICGNGIEESFFVTSVDENLDKIIIATKDKTCRDCYKETHILINNNKELIQDLAIMLFEKEQLTQEDLEFFFKTHNINI